MSDPNVSPVATPRKVLCVPTTSVALRFGNPQGFLPTHNALLLMIREVGQWRDKDETEKPPEFAASHAWKQVIPYVVVSQGEDVLTYWRAGDEKRLHGCYSLGLGGHVEESDGPEHVTTKEDRRANSVFFAAARELAEEAGLYAHSRSLRPVGIVNDDGDDVGKAHIGLVFRISMLSQDEIRPSTELLRPLFVPPNLIVPTILEPWSRHVLSGYLLKHDRRRAAS
jgi:predicted NUDIX family phosphoesterase